MFSLFNFQINTFCHHGYLFLIFPIFYYFRLNPYGVLTHFSFSQLPIFSPYRAKIKIQIIRLREPSFGGQGGRLSSKHFIVFINPALILQWKFFPHREVIHFVYIQNTLQLWMTYKVYPVKIIGFSF